MQRDLFQPAEIEFTLPEGQPGPRLWIRRLAIWQDHGTLLRNIELRRGVNIVWSPDLSMNGTGATPHGSGKTTFCRLIRYCLGERHFANEEQRPLMQQKLPNGFVGAEIIIDGECWVVTRPIGMNLPSRATRAERIEETFDQLLVGTEPPTIASAISDSFCVRYRDQVPDNLKSEQVWDVLLAWLTRDQECRLDDVFDWRSKRSGSGSAAQELSLETKLAVMRLAIRALSADEIQAAIEARTLTRERDLLRKTLNHLDWFQSERFADLCKSLSIPEGRDPTDEMTLSEVIDKANEELAKSVGTDHVTGQTASVTLKKIRLALQSERDKSSDARAQKQALLDSLPIQISAARAELGIEQARLETGVVVRCSICHVNIDEVTAKGCGISLERCNIGEVRSRIERTQANVNELERQKNTLPEEISRIDLQISGIEQQVSQIEEQETATSEAIDLAKERVREITQFKREMSKRVEKIQRMEGIEDRLSGQQKKKEIERERAAAAIGDLAKLFEKLVATLMPNGCSGRIRLDGNGLHPEISLERGAGLSTAAVESFKIVAFDLAAMILSVNDKADIPSFLIHDSPREADLDAGIYSNLFDFALGLEKMASPPPFQYIITTTTAPAQITSDHPALRLQLSSTPPEARLFAMDF